MAQQRFNRDMCKIVTWSHEHTFHDSVTCIFEKKWIMSLYTICEIDLSVIVA